MGSAVKASVPGGGAPVSVFSDVKVGLLSLELHEFFCILEINPKSDV